MSNPEQRSQKRSKALSREQIVTATIELLDSAGESALTVRALTAHLATGRGAIYHYVTDKEDLLAAATDGVIGGVFNNAGADPDPDPRRELRSVALGIFDALTEHPWVGIQLGREPLQPAVFRIWKGLAICLQRMGVASDARSDAGAAMVNYLLGAAAQYAATFRLTAAGSDRNAYLESLAAELIRSDSEAITVETAAGLVKHDDRAQFVAGIDIFLAGIDATR